MQHLEELLRANPAFHRWPDGTPAHWSLTPNAMRYLSAQLGPGMRTLETGAGQSTVVFAMHQTQHVCVSLETDVVDRIGQYCEANRIAADVRFVTESSDSALPRPGVVPDDLDVVLIDGAHRFPFPCIDFHYTESRLRVGGLIAIDDYTMPSVNILHEFLRREKEWQLATTIDRTSFYRRIAQTNVIMDCHGQEMNRWWFSGNHGAS